MFKSWCYENKLTGKRKDTSLSHVLMDGGVLSVPFDKLDEFYEQYITSVKRGETLFIVEQKTDLYNFFVDIDFKSDTPLNIDEIRDICKIICVKVKSHGGKDCLICVAHPKKVDNKVKTGIHLNWPGFVVNQKSALALRDHILVALYTVRENTDWDSFIDSAVYGDLKRGSKGSGFRMPFSYKKAKHDKCVGKGCEECNGEGRITQKSYYLPLFIYKYGPLNAILPIEQTPTVDIMKMATVRSNATEFCEVESPSIKNVKEESFFSTNEIKDEVNDVDIITEVENFIQNNLEGQHTAIVKTIYKHKNQFFVSTTSQYCENLGKRHGSNHVWFYISGDIIAQKCFCRCETLAGRKSGFCKDFIGRSSLLTNKLKKMLYPENVKCPDLKINKPTKIEDTIDYKPELENFIRKNVPGQDNLKIIKITKNKNSSMVFTNSVYCGIIKSDHEKCINYRVNGNILSQVCPCKKKINIKLSPRMFSLLKKK